MRECAIGWAREGSNGRRTSKIRGNKTLVCFNQREKLWINSAKMQKQN